MYLLCIIIWQIQSFFSLAWIIIIPDLGLHLRYFSLLNNWRYFCTQFSNRELINMLGSCLINTWFASLQFSKEQSCDYLVCTINKFVQSFCMSGLQNPELVWVWQYHSNMSDCILTWIWNFRVIKSGIGIANENPPNLLNWLGHRTNYGGPQ
jgi:hypothetical protein